MFVDTHAHLCWPDFAHDLPAVIERARAAGVERIVTIGTEPADCQQSVAIAERFAGVYAAVGLHPGGAARFASTGTEALRRLGTYEKVVAIGETGLDYYRSREHADAQKALLRQHLALAKDLNKPVIIHNRDADADLLEILREFRPVGVMHCFSGDAKFAFDCLELGLFISFTGILTFKNATALRMVAKALPLERLLLETDCPYLAPVPHRGRRNEPSYIPLIAQAVAELKGVTIAEVAYATTANAERLFRFS